MIIIDIINPENNEVEEKKIKKEKMELTESEKRNLPRTQLSIITIDGKIVSI